MVIAMRGQICEKRKRLCHTEICSLLIMIAKKIAIL